MKDRYLFGAKRLDNGEWVQGYLTIIEKINYYILPGKLKTVSIENAQIIPQMYKVDKDTICQCSGLKDKDGNLIWENDIVDFLGHKGTVKYECGSFGIVLKEIIDWEEIAANIMPITGCENTLYACENDNYISLWEIYWNFNDEDDCLNTIEIIGNKFDNSELIERRRHE